MVRLTQSLRAWLFKYHPAKLTPILFGHTELFTKEMQEEYIAWCQTEEGKSYLKGGSNYKESEEENG